MLRFQRFQALQQLDPVQDACEICRQVAGYEFPWDVTKALELALFRTFCIPSIGQLLDKTGEFHHRPQKRYDDTGLLVSSILKWGYDTDRGMAALERMNRIHAHFPISNTDYIYVLSTFVHEPVRWIERFGWRPLSEVEKQGLFYFWYTVGQKMGLQDVPSSYAQLEQFSLGYEKAHFRYSSATQRVGESTLNLFLSWFPSPLRPALKPVVYALLDDALLEAFGFPRPSREQRQRLERLLQWRGRLVRYLPPRRRPDFYVDMPQRSYPQGYTLEDLGPPALLRSLNQPPQ
ncbi:MAG TPA: oxygenase MpaB family protein [Trichocoleus sp.]